MRGKKVFFIALILTLLVILAVCSSNSEVKLKNDLKDISVRINDYFDDSAKRLNTLFKTIKEQINIDNNIISDSTSSKKILLFDNTVYYNPKVKDECAIWYSGYGNDKDIIPKLNYMAKFEKPMIKASKNKIYNNFVFLISSDNIIMSYPYLNFSIYITQKMDFNNYINDSYKQGKEPRWTPPYLDVMGTGYVTSYSRFINTDNKHKFYVLIDILIPEIYKRELKKKNTPMLILSPPYRIIIANKSCKKTFGISGLENKFYIKDVKFIIKEKDETVSRNEAEKEVNPDILDAFERITEKESTHIKYKNKKYKIISERIKIPGWLLLAFIKL